MSTAENSIPNLMTVAEAAEYLGVSETTMHRHTDNRQITHYRIGIARGTIRFAKNDLNDFLRQRET